MIQQIKQIKAWFCFLKRKAPYYPYPIEITIRGFCEGWWKKKRDFYFSLIICVFRDDGWIEEYYLPQEYENFQEIILEKIKNDRFFVDRMLAECRREGYKLLALGKKLDQVDTTNQELCAEVLHQFHQTYLISTWARSATWWGGRGFLVQMLESYLAKKGCQRSEVSEYLIILSSPLKPSFIFQERNSLLKIACKLQAGFDVRADLEEHTKRFAWIPFDYNGPKLYTERYFYKEVREMIKAGKNVSQNWKKHSSYFKELRSQQAALFKRLKIDARHERMFKDLQTMIWHQDFKKEIYTQVHVIAWRFLQRLARARNIKAKDLVFLTSQELEEFILSNELNQKELGQRKEFCLIIFTVNGTRVLVGPDAKSISAIIQKRLIEQENIVQNSRNTRIKGQAASKGKVKGKVRRILDPSQINTMAVGEILVTKMTTPVFLPAIKKASAIITDEGGITCHAAIVSRELGIPCIIGTKIATQVLKDGDMVEVDADRGVVRVLSRQN